MATSKCPQVRIIELEEKIERLTSRGIEDLRFENARLREEAKGKAPITLHFPVTLRKMWSGGEVQEWINGELALLDSTNKGEGDGTS
ncbi:MAG: hypothetical protein ACI9DH_000583 [Halioglobus sp.]|jgi:hypothetical protein